MAADVPADVPWDDYQHLKLNASQLGVQVNDDELSLQVAGGVNKKGLVYGLGNHTHAYYKRVEPPTQSSLSTPTSYTPSMYPQLVSRLQNLEEQLNAIKEEFTLMKEEVKQTKDAIARIESRFGGSAMLSFLLVVVTKEGSDHLFSATIGLVRGLVKGILGDIPSVGCDEEEDSLAGVSTNWERPSIGGCDEKEGVVRTDDGVKIKLSAHILASVKVGSAIGSQPSFRLYNHYHN
ncbi:hypothetical protein Cgig2_005784 [Carnegiea gigantea]|uniref:Uncharacterized protein n=1 Tax=Carnegiea gigantea TaxID=171969 RepID=A0A9Q1JZQ5_9CARY|nr:hypothetical protein Cgig2_005784 [Carnegiea gigantea]